MKEAVFHLTLTGYYAGMPICGITRQEASEKGHTFRHAVYCSDEQIASSECCPNCRQVWNESAEEDEDEA
jgi:hypothetical protein